MGSVQQMPAAHLNVYCRRPRKPSNRPVESEAGSRISEVAESLLFMSGDGFRAECSSVRDIQVDSIVGVEKDLKLESNVKVVVKPAEEEQRSEKVDSAEDRKVGNCEGEAKLVAEQKHDENQSRDKSHEGAEACGDQQQQQQQQQSSATSHPVVAECEVKSNEAGQSVQHAREAVENMEVDDPVKVNKVQVIEYQRRNKRQLEQKQSVVTGPKRPRNDAKLGSYNLDHTMEVGRELTDRSSPSSSPRTRRNADSDSQNHQTTETGREVTQKKSPSPRGRRNAPRRARTVSARAVKSSGRCKDTVENSADRRSNWQHSDNEENFSTRGTMVEKTQVVGLPEGVSRWLQGLGLIKYAENFEKHEVEDEILPLLTFDDLREMGISAVGARRKMYTAIQGMEKKVLL